MIDSVGESPGTRSSHSNGGVALQVPGERAVSRSTGLSIAAPSTLVFVLGAGALLRFVNINALGFNSDEAVYSGQAASLSGDPDLSLFFPIFRAHPMVFQYILSLAYTIFGVHDIIGRSLVAIVGLATILLVYRAGTDLYGQGVGLVAATLMAVMPYHVIVTRQVLLDGPLTFCTTLTLVLLIRFALTGRTIYLMGVGAALGLTFLTKETGFVLATAAFAFLALTPQIQVRFWPLVGAGISMMIPILMFPLSVALAGKSDTARSYLVWQLLRRSNHTWDFFPTVVPPAMGWFVLLAAAVGLMALRSQRTWRETLLIAWIVLPTFVFQIWPVKGFQYLLPVAPAVAILAARTLVLWRPRWFTRPGWRLPWLNIIATVLVVVSIALPAWRAGADQNATSRMAGAGGIPGVREAGEWIDVNTPEGAVFAAIGPSMANLVQYYGHRKAYGLSVSTNPLHRNPSYFPVSNPDAAFRYGEIQYLVWDSFSASRSPFFESTLLRYVDKYNATEVFAFTIPGVTSANGTIGEQRIIVIYEVRP